MKNDFNYWLLVRDCLVQLHSFYEINADSAVFNYLAKLSDQDLIDFATHEEAFYLSCQLANKRVRELTEKEEVIYNELKKKHES